jgi:8-oxo-dGTP diphosphatase
LKKGSYTYEFPRPTVTVDVVVFGLDMGLNPPTLNVLLIKRGRPGTPFEGHWAIPGGFVDENEDLATAAHRELVEETHAECSYIEQLATFGKPGRDPRGHVISVAYMALVRTDSTTIQGDDDAAEAAWWPVGDLSKIDLAFDHDEILGVALKRLRSKLRWQPIGIDLLPETFTLTDLQRVYEVVLGRTLDKRNFRKRVQSYDILVSAQSRRIGAAPGPPPKLWRFDRAAYEAMIEDGEEFEI